MDKAVEWKSGDIFGQPSGGILYWLSNLFTTPGNKCIHHGILEYYDEEHDEWWVLESTSSRGVCRNPVGNRKIKVYRVNIANQSQREIAVQKVLNYTGAYYDWKLGFQLFWHGLPRLLAKRRKLTAKELSEGWYKHDKFYICTEAALRGYLDQDIEIVPRGILPLPCSIKEAENLGKIEEIK